MFRLVRWRNKFTSLLFTLAPLHSRTTLSSTDAFLISTQRSHRHLATLGSDARFRYNSCRYRRIKRQLTGLLATDTDLNTELAKSIRETYDDKETDGILELAVSSSLMLDSTLDIEDTLVPAILEASRGTKGVAASIMNALVGSTCVLTISGEAKQNLSLLSSRILALMEALEETGDVVPDIVTYSLAYRALSSHPDWQNLADNFLEEAERQSKKIAGGKRRKLLASAKRQKISTFVEAEENLKEILGDDFRVLMETDEFAVVNKPSGVPCFHKKKTTAGKIKKGKGKKKKASNKTGSSQDSSDFSLEDALMSCNVNLSTLNPDALGLVHRLDRGSSGCMVLAKTNEMHATLIAEFFLRRTTKKYVALLRESSTSSIPNEEIVLIDNPVKGRPARSQYMLLKRYESSSDEDSGDNALLAEFEIFTGRKHQIRVHASEVLGSPVWGDPLYGDIEKTDKDNSKRIFLHACHLTIPQIGIDVESPHPDWWQSQLSTVKN